MYVETVRNRNSPPAILLRESRRDGRKVLKRTIYNLTSWPHAKIDMLRRLLRDEPLAAPGDLFITKCSLPHGHVEAVLGTIRSLGLDRIVSSKRCRQADLVLAMIAQRLLHPCSKLAATRDWENSTLAQELAVEGADVDELYDALDWLLERQDRIENKLAAKHLREGGLVLYDVTSSYYEGRTCTLARLGHDRDGKRGMSIIVYGVMTDGEGRPVAVDVYPGNTGDPKTVPDQVNMLRERFGLGHVILVGDRGMLTQTQLKEIERHPGIGWISALRSPAIRKLLERGLIQMSLFDEKNLAEIHSPDYPGERLVACYNPLLAEERRRKREDLLQATEKDLERLRHEVQRRTRTPLTAAQIGVKAGRIVNRFKVAKHFKLTIDDGAFQWERRAQTIACESDLDGIYVIRTSEPVDRLPADDAVRSYKSLARVERAFRCLKGIDLLVRPIRHRTEDHVRAHIFLCMLAYYVEWHMREALAPLLFEDEELDHDRKHRDPVAPAQPSASVKAKKAQRTTDDELPVHSLETLLRHLATRCRITRVLKAHPDAPPHNDLTEPTPVQARAFKLLRL